MTQPNQHSDTAAVRLVRALNEANAPRVLILRAQDGYYGDFTSPLATPITELVKELEIMNLLDLAQRAMKGEFDGR